MKNSQRTLFVSKSRAAVQVVAAACLTFVSAFMPTGSAQAETAPAQISPHDQSQVKAIEVHGQKIPEGPHCLYMNFATVPVRSSSGLLLIKTRVNGEPATMIADTGALHTLLTVQEAEKLGLKMVHSKITETDANGNLGATYAATVNDISLDKYFWHNVKLGVVSQVAKSSSELAGADILLNGYHKDVEFSLATREIKFFVPSAECRDSFLAYWDDNASEVPLADLSADDPREIVTVEINGHQMTALIDSGSPISMIDLKAAARVGITPKSAGVSELTADGTRKQDGKAWLAPFESFAIGSETVKNPKIGIADLWGPAPVEPAFKSALRLASIAPRMPGTAVLVDPTKMSALSSEAMMGERPDMLLGADFLRSHRVLLAMSQNRLYYSYLGGKVFDNDDESKTAEPEQARLDTTTEDRHSPNL